MYSWGMAGAKPVIQDDVGDCTVTIGSSGDPVIGLFRDVTRIYVFREETYSSLTRTRLLPVKSA